MNRRTLVSLLAILNLVCVAALGASLGTALTYQGCLTEGGVAYTGSAELQATLWDAVANGSQVAANSPAIVSVSVSNGLFALPLDFGASFTGNARWLQLEVRTTLGSFTLLLPRQPLTPAPYALNAALAGGLLSLPNAPLDMTVSGQRALRLEPATNGGPNVIGGCSLNSVSAGVSGATIGGGGGIWAEGAYIYSASNQVRADFGTVAGGSCNTSSGDGATVGGGYYNTSSDQWATVGGGGDNLSSGYSATVGGGRANTGSGWLATVGGGGDNVSGGASATVGGGRWNTSSGDWATVSGGGNNMSSGYGATVGGGGGNISSSYGAAVGGGYYNRSSTNSATVGGGFGNSSSGEYATVGGGLYNASSATYAVVGGGYQNTNSGVSATIGGGDNNRATSHNATVGGGNLNLAGGDTATVGGGAGNLALGGWSTVPGGRFNTAAGDYSLAAGYRAKANHKGSFVLADSQENNLLSETENELLGRFTGGVRFWTSMSVGVRVWPGATSWSVMCDRNLKDNFQPVNARRVLQRLADLPIQTWNLKAQDTSIRHIGPVAQDFRAAFDVGEDEKYISTSDADGVALAAIQGLNEVVKEKEARIEKLEKDVAELKAMVSSLVKK